MGSDAVTRISVIVPTRNRPALLREALESIRRLERDGLVLEILVGDNGDDPLTQEVAREFGASHLRAPRVGAAAARNVCLDVVTGDYVAFLDDDDVWLDGHLIPHLALLRARPDLEAVFSQRVWADTELRPVAAPDPAADPGQGKDLLRNIIGGAIPQIGTMLVRKPALASVGQFDEALVGGTDWDWTLRFARRETLGYVPHLSNIVRGRPPGTYNTLQFSRLRYDWRIFLRHVTANWRVWRSPLDLMRAYRGTFGHYYGYFEDAALALSERGDRAGVFGAIWGAFRIFPLRALHNSLANRPLRQSLLKVLTRARDDATYEGERN
jgi:glycosyltransferase involved in cell wall biosynthesis